MIAKLVILYINILLLTNTKSKDNDVAPDTCKYNRYWEKNRYVMPAIHIVVNGGTSAIPDEILIGFEDGYSNNDINNYLSTDPYHPVVCDKLTKLLNIDTKYTYTKHGGLATKRFGISPPIQCKPDY